MDVQSICCNEALLPDIAKRACCVKSCQYQKCGTGYCNGETCVCSRCDGFLESLSPEENTKEIPKLENESIFTDAIRKDNISFHNEGEVCCEKYVDDVWKRGDMCKICCPTGKVAICSSEDWGRKVWCRCE